MKKMTDMMTHYLTVKERYKDCIIFYRLGDFYEMFFDDAVKASQILDLTLTGRDCGLEQRAPMCGVPYHAADNYIGKLVEAGEKVAICEQLEDPATAKGMVKRDVIRVVTPGTVISDGQLQEGISNYVCCAYKNGLTAALSWADITTGELAAMEFYGENCVKQTIGQMIKLGVREIICNEEMLFATKDEYEFTRGILPKVSNYPEWAFGQSAAERILLNQLKAQTLTAYSIAGKVCAISAAGALLEYLKETQMHAMKNIDSVNFLSEKDRLQLDGVAIRNLEIVRTLGTGKKYGALLWVLDKTATAMGKRLLANEIVAPFESKSDINYRLNGVEELYNSTVVRLSISEMLKEIKDIERLAGKISNGNVLPKDCLALSKSLSVIPNIKFQLSGFKSEIIQKISEGLFDMSDIADLIDRAIVEEPPSQLKMKEGGYIKDGYSKELDELRAIKKNGGNLIIEMEARERDVTGIRNLKINYNRIFGYYIEVTQSFKDKVPLHYQRKQTLANSERYTTDELKILEEKIIGSSEQALKLEERIFDFIKSVLSENINKFKTISSAVALLDLITGFAEVAKANKYVRPEIVGSSMPLIIKDGRHPVVEMIAKDKFIPNDTVLDEDENRTMIITGPNMAGKSTFMRQTAIIVIMAHMGCFVPAKYAQIPIIDRVFTRVGASDNLISDQSTFMVEMIEVATIIQNATKNSLLILDEVGRGTSTYDGLSIAWALIEHITDKIGAKTMFATHYHELTELETSLNGVKNYKISAKEINGSVVFLRKILRGGANRSFGIEVAALAGVPESVTVRAKTILKNIESGEKQLCTQLTESDDIYEAPSEIETILREIKIDEISPMQAFLLLSDLIEKAKDE